MGGDDAPDMRPADIVTTPLRGGQDNAGHATRYKYSLTSTKEPKP